MLVGEIIIIIISC